MHTYGIFQQAISDNLKSLFTKQLIDAAYRDELIAYLDEHLASLFNLTPSPEFHFIDKILQHSSLASYWRDLLNRKKPAVMAKLGIKYPLNAQPKLANYSLIKGCYFAEQAFDADTEKAAADYFQLALNENNFQVLQYENRISCEKLADLQQNPEINDDALMHVENMFDSASSIPQYHVTPGYIELAKTCLSICCYHLAVTKNPDKIVAASKLTLENLMIARELQPFSGAEIINAYQTTACVIWIECLGKAVVIEEAIDKLSKIFLANKFLSDDDITNCVIRARAKLPPEYTIAPPISARSS